MLREIFLGVSLCFSLSAIAAEERSVDEVLKTSAGVSEEQLDETAERVMTDSATLTNEAQAKLNAKSNAVAQASVGDPGATATAAGGAMATSTTTATGVDAKPIPEAQIPVLKNEKAAKSETAAPWLRLISSAIFVLLTGTALFIGVKKMAKQKNIGGKKAKIEVLHQHFLGPKRSVALIQVAGEAILIGVTDHSINMIKSVALIDDELDSNSQDFHGFLEDDFTVEQLTAQRGKARII